MKLDSVKTKKSKIPRSKNLFKKISAALISIAVFMVSFMIITRANSAATDTVSVLRVKAAGGRPLALP